MGRHTAKGPASGPVSGWWEAEWERRVRDARMRETAARLQADLPAWWVMWGVYSGRLWALPCTARAPWGLILDAADPQQLVDQIGAAVREMWLRPEPVPQVTPAWALPPGPGIGGRPVRAGGGGR